MDLVILHGVAGLLEGVFPFTEYTVEFGNEDRNGFDIRACLPTATRRRGIQRSALVLSGEEAQCAQEVAGTARQSDVSDHHAQFRRRPRRLSTART